MATSGMRTRTATALAALVLAAAGCSGGGDDDGGGSASATTAGGEARSAARALGDAAAAEVEADGGAGGNATSDTTAAAEGGDAAGGAASEDLPAPTFPESTPPTTAPGTEALTVPGARGDDPLFGQVYVDVDPGGHSDHPVQLREGQHIQVLSSADDGIRTQIEVYAPDGRQVGTWEGGEPGSVTGYYWDDQDALPLTGTYVFRVVHTGGSDEPFLLTFFGEA